MMSIKDKLISAATAYDKKQSKKKYYNIYALPQYFIRIDEIMSKVDKGESLRRALINGFSDRLLSYLLKVVDEADFTKEEIEKSNFLYD